MSKHDLFRLEHQLIFYSRLTHLTTPTTTLLMKIFRLAYFFLPYGASSTTPAMSALKQCLHYDTDSKQCLPAHRLVKAFDKSFKKVDEAVLAENWAAVIGLLVGSESASGFASKFDEALTTHTSSEALVLPSYIPARPARRISPRREVVLRALCRAYTNLKLPDKAEDWCEELLHMEGLENDADGLVGRGEAALKKEEWDDAVRSFEKAFESSGRSNREVQPNGSFYAVHSDQYPLLDPPTFAKSTEIAQTVPSKGLLQSLRCFSRR